MELKRKELKKIRDILEENKKNFEVAEALFSCKLYTNIEGREWVINGKWNGTRYLWILKIDDREVVYGKKFLTRLYNEIVEAKWKDDEIEEYVKGL